MKKNPISTELEQFVIGAILGDSHIRYTGKTSRANTRIEFAHSTKQEEYIQWKYDFLKEYELAASPPRLYKIGKEKEFLQLRFTSKSNKIFNEYHYLFHKEGKKKITRKILNKLQPLGLAIWYMDDGNLSLQKYTKKDGEQGIHARRLMLNTQGFTYEEHKIIQRYFKVAWNMDVNINKNNGYYRIVMGAKSANIFIELIKPYIIPSMEYKIDMKYKNTKNPINYHNAEQPEQRVEDIV